MKNFQICLGKLKAELNNSDHSCHGVDSFTTMLQHLNNNAAKNAEKLSEDSRHLEIIKKFATPLFIIVNHSRSLDFMVC